MDVSFNYKPLKSMKWFGSTKKKKKKKNGQNKKWKKCTEFGSS